MSKVNVGFESAASAALLETVAQLPGKGVDRGNLVGTWGEGVDLAVFLLVKACLLKQGRWTKILTHKR
jgi:hypothetical protein